VTGGGGRRLDTYFARGILETRATLFITVRLALRFNQLVQPTGAAGGGAGLWRVTVPVFVLVDLLVWWRLRRSDRFGLAWRLPLDCADMAFWALSPVPGSGRYDWAVLAVMPLAIEAGFRWGLRALTVPAAAAVVAGAVRSLAGRPLLLDRMTWLLVSVVMGMALLGYCRRLHSRAEEEHRQRLAAESRRAFLAGQNAVAMGASSAVDAIEGLVPIVGRPAPGSALWRLADGWKSELSQTTAAEATYLQVALLEWERAHNRHPDLATLVEVHVPEGEGTTLLTGSQVGRLGHVLDAQGLCGRVEVRRSSSTEHVPGSPLGLWVGEHRVVVPSDPSACLRGIEPGAIVYLFIALLVVGTVFPTFGALPLPAIAGGVWLCLAAGWWTHRRLLRDGPRARLAVFGGAVVVALAITVVAELTAREYVGADGDTLVHFGSGTLLLAFYGGMYHAAFGHGEWAFPVAYASVVATGIVLSPVAFETGAVAGSIVWNLTPYPPGRRFSWAMARAADQHAGLAEAGDAEAVAAAFEEGRDSVVELVSQARDDAVHQLGEVRASLDPAVARMAERRIEEVGRRLSMLGSEPASWSSTTTS
jgi:hypothetical protein